MMIVPQTLTNVTHPLVASMYMKKDFCGTDHAEDVLVIKTNFINHEDQFENFDQYLAALLGDLQDLRAKAEMQVGKFDRVDIRAS